MRVFQRVAVYIKTMSTFTPEEYATLRRRSRSSADVVLPIALETIPAQSVIDVGCGVGTWLAACEARGLTDYLGIDGDGASASLDISPDRFRVVDLTQPFGIGRTFDLAMSLEVAEHLPAASATHFVTELTTLAPAVLFSAAIPGQGGTRHINEQWPSYWAGLFQARGYVPMDVIRPRVWDHPDVDWWYQQNTLLYVRTALLNVAHPMMHGRHRARLTEVPKSEAWRARDLPLTNGITATSDRPYLLRCPTCHATASALRSDHASRNQEAVLYCDDDGSPLQVVRVIVEGMFNYYTPGELRAQ
jgi:SAM-dependent methyltransferase